MLTTNEKRIRQIWLGCTISTFVLPILFYLIAFPKSTLADTLIVLGVSLAFAGVLFTITYHCAYKKFGNRFLTFSIGLVASNLVKDVIENSITLDRILPLILNLGWAIISVKLIEVNKSYKARELLHCQPYQNALASFQAASNAIELDEHFHRAVNEMPKYFKFLKKEYKAAKKGI